MSSVSNTRVSLSGLEFRVLSRELSSSLEGAYVSNIYSMGESQLLWLRRPAGREGGEPSEVSLVLSPKWGAWVTEQPSRVETTEFTSALRSDLLRAKLESVTQFDLDRVLVFRFLGKGEGGHLKLVVELMPPGNIILLGADDLVLLALHEVRTDGRRVSKGRPYVPPPQTRASLETLTREDLERALSKERTMGRALGRGLSIPRRYVDEILARLSRAQGDSTAVDAPEVDKIFAASKELLQEVETDPWPCLVRTEGDVVEVMVTRPKGRQVLESSRTLSPLLDKLLYPELMTTEEENAVRDLREKGRGEATSEAHQRRVAEYKATIADLESKKAAMSKLSGELRKLSPLVGAAPDPELALSVAKGSRSIPSDLVDSLVSLSAKGQASMASAIFDRAKRAEREILEIDKAIGGLESKLKKETQKAESIRVKVIPLSRARKEWYEKFRWFFTTGGKLAIGGRDAQSNSMLIRRHMEDGDTVYHADLFGSPFFVLKGGRGQKEEEVREVAKATVTFSSAWKTGLGAADAYWVSPDQVSSAGPSGEYLAHGSFAIRGKKNFVTKNPVELSVGVDDEGRIVSGPEESIMKVARAHVALVPSREKPSDTAKKVLHELLPYAGPGASPTVDDVLRMLPAGGGKIVRRRVDKKA